MRSEVSGVRSSCDRRRDQVLAARLLVAEVGDVLQRQDEAGGLALGRGNDVGRST